MNNYDLIPDFNKLRHLFVLESPHVDELKLKLPCVGDAGKIMCQGVFNQSDLSFGEYLNEKRSGSEEFGIMNSFSFPLGIESELNFNQMKFSALKKIKWFGGVSDRNSFYQEHLNVLSEIENVEELTQFKSRLLKYSYASDLRLIIFCGYIAQAMYLYSFKSPIPAYNRIQKIELSTDRHVSILFVNHPSKKNDRWHFNRSILRQT